MSDDRAVRYVEVGAGPDGEDLVVYRASGLGTCPRVFVALANGRVPAPTPQWMQEVWDEGHAFEDTVRRKYARECEVEVFDDQREVQLDLGTVAGAHVVVRGHIDNLGIRHTGKGQGEVVLIDYKKVRESGWDAYQRQGIEWQNNYPWQMSVYWHALVDEGVELIAWDLVGGKLVRENDWDDGEITELGVHTGLDAPLSLRAIRQKVAAVERLIAQGFDAPEVECTGATYPCPFFYLHDPEPESDTFEWPEDAEVKVLLDGRAEVMERVAAAKKELGEAETAKREFDKGIYALIEHYGRDADVAKKLVGHGYVVTRTRSEVKEHTVKASTRDYLTVKKIDNDNKGKA